MALILGVIGWLIAFLPLIIKLVQFIITKVLPRLSMLKGITIGTITLSATVVNGLLFSGFIGSLVFVLFLYRNLMYDLVRDYVVPLIMVLLRPLFDMLANAINGIGDNVLLSFGFSLFNSLDWQSGIAIILTGLGMSISIGSWMRILKV